MYFLNFKMIINNRYTPRLDEYSRIATTNLRNLNVKKLKMIDPELAKTYCQYKLMGGSIKSFFQRIGNTAKKILNVMPQVSRTLHTLTGHALNFLNSPVGKSIIDKLGKAAEAGLKMPGLAKIINKIPEVAKKGFDGLTEIINNVKNKTGVPLDQAKNLVQDIYNTSKEIYKDYQDDKQKALEETKKISEKVGDIIKEEGVSAGLMKSAKYLPLMRLVNPVYTKKSKDGGMINLPVPRFKKPSDLIRKYISEQAVKDYPTAAVNKYAGRLYLGGSGMCGPTPKGLKNPLASSGRLYLGGSKSSKSESTSKSNLLDKLRKGKL